MNRNINKLTRNQSGGRLNKTLIISYVKQILILRNAFKKNFNIVECLITKLNTLFFNKTSRLYQREELLEFVEEFSENMLQSHQPNVDESADLDEILEVKKNLQSQLLVKRFEDLINATYIISINNFQVSKYTKQNVYKFWYKKLNNKITGRPFLKFLLLFIPAYEIVNLKKQFFLMFRRKSTAKFVGKVSCVKRLLKKTLVANEAGQGITRVGLILNRYTRFSVKKQLKMFNKKKRVKRRFFRALKAKRRYHYKRNERKKRQLPRVQQIKRLSSKILYKHVVFVVGNAMIGLQKKLLALDILNKGFGAEVDADEKLEAREKVVKGVLTQFLTLVHDIKVVVPLILFYERWSFSKILSLFYKSLRVLKRNLINNFELIRCYHMLKRITLVLASGQDKRYALGKRMFLLSGRLKQSYWRIAKKRFKKKFKFKSFLKRRAYRIKKQNKKKKKKYFMRKIGIPYLDTAKNLSSLGSFFFKKYLNKATALRNRKWIRSKKVKKFTKYPHFLTGAQTLKLQKTRKAGRNASRALLRKLRIFTPKKNVRSRLRLWKFIKFLTLGVVKDLPLTKKSTKFFRNLKLVVSSKKRLFLNRRTKPVSKAGLKKQLKLERTANYRKPSEVEMSEVLSKLVDYISVQQKGRRLSKRKMVKLNVFFKNLSKVNKRALYIINKVLNFVKSTKFIKFVHFRHLQTSSRFVQVQSSFKFKQLLKYTRILTLAKYKVQRLKQKNFFKKKKIILKKKLKSKWGSRRFSRRLLLKNVTKSKIFKSSLFFLLRRLNVLYKCYFYASLLKNRCSKKALILANLVTSLKQIGLQERVMWSTQEQTEFVIEQILQRKNACVKTNARNMKAVSMVVTPSLEWFRKISWVGDNLKFNKFETLWNHAWSKGASRLRIKRNRQLLLKFVVKVGVSNEFFKHKVAALLNKGTFSKISYLTSYYKLRSLYTLCKVGMQNLWVEKIAKQKRYFLKTANYSRGLFHHKRVSFFNSLKDDARHVKINFLGLGDQLNIRRKSMLKGRRYFRRSFGRQLFKKLVKFNFNYFNVSKSGVHTRSRKLFKFYRGFLRFKKKRFRKNWNRFKWEYMRKRAWTRAKRKYKIRVKRYTTFKRNLVTKAGKPLKVKTGMGRLILRRVRRNFFFTFTDALGNVIYTANGGLFRIKKRKERFKWEVLRKYLKKFRKLALIFNIKRIIYYKRIRNIFMHKKLLKYFKIGDFDLFYIFPEYVRAHNGCRKKKKRRL